MPLRVLPDTLTNLGGIARGGNPPLDIQFASDGQLYGVYADGNASRTTTHGAAGSACCARRRRCNALTTG